MCNKCLTLRCQYNGALSDTGARYAHGVFIEPDDPAHGSGRRNGSEAKVVRLQRQGIARETTRRAETPNRSRAGRAQETPQTFTEWRVAREEGIGSPPGKGASPFHAWRSERMSVDGGTPTLGPSNNQPNNEAPAKIHGKQRPSTFAVPPSPERRKIATPFKEWKAPSLGSMSPTDADYQPRSHNRVTVSASSGGTPVGLIMSPQERNGFGSISERQASRDQHQVSARHPQHLRREESFENSGRTRPALQSHTPQPQVFGVRLTIPYEHAPPNAHPEAHQSSVPSLSPFASSVGQSGVAAPSSLRATGTSSASNSSNSKQESRVKIVRERGTITDSVPMRSIAVSTRRWDNGGDEESFNGEF